MALNSQPIGLFGEGELVDIHPAIWPAIGISTEIRPYASLRGPAVLSLDRGGIDFATGGRATLNGYFNLFNLGKWRDLCGDMPICLRLEGRGRFIVTIWCESLGRSRERLFSGVVELDTQAAIPLEIPSGGYRRAIIFFDITAVTEGRLDDFSWATQKKPCQLPKLVVSVTTFRREAAVKKTVERFLLYLRGSGFGDYVRMNIVDNGQSLALPKEEGIAVLPNANLGGAGGFARGMMQAQDEGATHCLLMDDDASVHMRAITRTWMLLAYTMDSRTAVAGAMINADHAWQIWENGAIFDRGCRPLYFCLDMRKNSDVMRMEFETNNPAPSGFYGGWWFFAFPLANLQHLPFPFFVRGDDVSFSLANNFRIVTLPGVASVQESFVDKASPQTWYLDMRSHLAHHLSLPNKAVSWLAIQRMFLSFYLRTALRFHYESLSAVNLAIEDTMRGPEFFAEHADMAQRRADLKALTVTEAWKPIDRAPRVSTKTLPRPLRALLLLTLNGHLIPFANFLGGTKVVEVSQRENFRTVYGARRIVYLNADRSAAYTVSRNYSAFFKETWRLIRNSLRLRKRWHHHEREWRNSYSALTSDEFWRKKFDAS